MKLTREQIAAMYDRLEAERLAEQDKASDAGSDADLDDYEPFLPEWAWSVAVVLALIVGTLFGIAVSQPR